MSVWNSYAARTRVRGSDKQEIMAERERRFLTDKFKNSLSYHNVIMDGKERQISVISSDNLDIKTICSLPGEEIRHGCYIEWKGFTWLVIEKDYDDTLYTKAKMRQCNHLLKWIENGEILERWCIVEDGTKYLTGEYGDNQYIITRGDMRVSLTIGRDEDTVKFKRNQRFLIDDEGSIEPMAYQLSKPYKMGANYKCNGIFIFILQECNLQDTDNTELMIADYYDTFPIQKPEVNNDRLYETDDFLNENKTPEPAPPKKKVWL